jgi:LacI family transcriptional regulator
MAGRSDTKRVTVALTYGAALEGDVALGIIDYRERAPHWRFVGTAGGPFTRFDDLEVNQIDGVIGFFYGSARDRDCLAAAQQAGVAAVNISNAAADVPLARVSGDEESAGRMGAEHLLDRGFANFGFIKQGETWYSQRRLDGFREVIERQPGRRCAVLTAPMSRDEADPKGVRRWLAELPKPIAIMAATDFLGGQVIDQAVALGLSVPDDVAVLGVDNNKWDVAMASLPLSSIEHDLRQIGYRAAELLDGLMDGGAPPAKPRPVPPIGVVSRHSTDVVLTKDPLVGQALAYIRDHCVDGINVDDVLNALGVSRRKLEMHMNRVTGQSPKTAISRAQVERAKRMLTGSADTMDQIARACGWDLTNRFFIVFKRITGMTPGQYRRRFGTLHPASPGPP